MNPIILKLHRFSNNNKTSTIKDSKTKALFFSRVLDLQPGKPFELNVDKWIALQRSGLFSNLTAKSVVIKDSRSNNSESVALEISGIENPSTTFAPEIGVSLSITTPEVCGGVIFKDRNFRGMGEKLEVLFQKAEGSEQGVNDLPPVLKMSWNANKIGQSSYISAGVEDVSFMQYMKNLIPSVVQKVQFSEYERSFVRVPAQSSKVFLQKEGFRYFQNRRHASIKKHESEEEEDSPISRIDYSVQGYMNQLTRSTVLTSTKQENSESLEFSSTPWDDCSFLTMTGIKSTLAESRQSGAMIQGWHDGGYLRLFGSKNLFSFNQLGARINFPATFFTLYEKLGRSAACFKVSANAMRAWGDGCVPLLHLRSVGDANVVRGFPVSEKTVHNHLLGHASVKSDIYFDKLVSFCSLGLFLDAVSCLQNGNEQSRRPFLSAGVSIRAKGFRVDLGAPLLQDRRVFRIQFGQDLESH
eukprot:gene26046-34648_t